MSFIGYIPYDDASDELKALYERYGGADKTPANIVRIAGPNPKAMQGHIDFYRAIMYGPSPLSRAQREMIAVTVSAINKCHYWIEHHWTALRRLADQVNRESEDSGDPKALYINDELKDALVTNHRLAHIPDKDKLMLEYVEMITRTPAAIDAEYIDHLKKAGFDNHTLHDIVQVAAYFAYVNRLADGLGIELEDDESKR